MIRNGCRSETPGKQEEEKGRGALSASPATKPHQAAVEDEGSEKPGADGNIEDLPEGDADAIHDAEEPHDEDDDGGGKEKVEPADEKPRSPGELGGGVTEDRLAPWFGHDR
jgi:hypothetical protein